VSYIFVFKYEIKKSCFHLMYGVVMGKHSILTVDDEPGLLKSLSHLKDHFEIVTAFNGQEGYKQYKSHPDLSMVLLDLNMPVMNGA